MYLMTILMLSLSSQVTGGCFRQLKYVLKTFINCNNGSLRSHVHEVLPVHQNILF